MVHVTSGVTSQNRKAVVVPRRKTGMRSHHEECRTAVCASASESSKPASSSGTATVGSVGDVYETVTSPLRRSGTAKTAASPKPM